MRIPTRTCKQRYWTLFFVVELENCLRIPPTSRPHFTAEVDCEFAFGFVSPAVSGLPAKPNPPPPLIPQRWGGGGMAHTTLMLLAGDPECAGEPNQSHT